MERSAHSIEQIDARIAAFIRISSDRPDPALSY
jgi:hypothetical protein